jgi:glyoxylase-like metal-dependent hydrolase (beta-lactamase superfamily II)
MGPTTTKAPLAHCWGLARRSREIQRGGLCGAVVAIAVMRGGTPGLDRTEPVWIGLEGYGGCRIGGSGVVRLEKGEGSGSGPQAADLVAAGQRVRSGMKALPACGGLIGSAMEHNQRATKLGRGLGLGGGSGDEAGAPEAERLRDQADSIGGSVPMGAVVDRGGGSVASAGRARSVEIAPGVRQMRVGFVNVFFVGSASGWVLVDAGLPGYAGAIEREAARLFGAGTRPRAIVLTHGHFDHVGALKALTRKWDVPVYAHRLELPYLTGRSAYPPPDPTAGGAMAWASPLMPRRFDFGDRVRALPEDGAVPGLEHGGGEAWVWIHTPGHTPGNVSLFRSSDRTLIAGDAFVATNQESLLSVLLQRKEIHGPPAYFTPDFGAAWDSVSALAELRPRAAGTGHGPPLFGRELLDGLERLAREFDEVAVPKRGRYVDEPALADESGIVFVPERRGMACRRRC